MLITMFRVILLFDRESKSALEQNRTESGFLRSVLDYPDLLEFCTNSGWTMVILNPSFNF